MIWFIQIWYCFIVLKEKIESNFMGLIEEAWESLGDYYLDSLMISMQGIVNAVVEAKRWYSHY